MRYLAIFGNFRMMTQSILLLLLSLVLIPEVTASAYAGDYSTEYKIKAAYLYNFTKFVTWPEPISLGTTQTITICIVGKNPFGSFLEPLTLMEYKNTTLTVETIEDIDALEKKNCQILFISDSEKATVAEILKKTSKMHILTVSDIDRFANHFGIIGFVLKDGKVRLEINLRAANQAGLKISAKLLEIATVVQ
jgi:hypothetical protein